MITRMAEQIADTILYEGYLLYPYRASAPKNRNRWQIGLVMPRDYAQAVGSDPWFIQTECLAECDPATMLTVRVRCLHVQERAVEQRLGGCPPVWHAVPSLRLDDRELFAWDEAVACESTREMSGIHPGGSEARWIWDLEAHEETQLICDSAGLASARVVRRRQPVRAAVHVQTEACGAVCRIRVRVENITPSDARCLADRGAALRQSLVGTHVILALDGGAFVSLLEPPRELTTLAASCVNQGTFPVLAGPAGSRQVVLASPIILYDYPAVAPESVGHLYDSTEIDELLMLRVRTLTDAEKREATATDARAAAIVAQCDAAAPEALGRLHGAVRTWETFLNPPEASQPESASVEVQGVRIGRGSRVRVQPARAVDSLDICLTHRTATVVAVYRTLEDVPYVAVTLDDDPFGAEGTKYRRSLYFHPEELVPLPGGIQ